MDSESSSVIRQRSRLTPTGRERKHANNDENKFCARNIKHVETKTARQYVENMGVSSDTVNILPLR